MGVQWCACVCVCLFSYEAERLTLPTAIRVAAVWEGPQKDEGESDTFTGQVEHSQVNPAVKIQKNEAEKECRWG